MESGKYRWREFQSETNKWSRHVLSAHQLDVGSKPVHHRDQIVQNTKQNWKKKKFKLLLFSPVMSRCCEAKWSKVKQKVVGGKGDNETEKKIWRPVDRRILTQPSEANDWSGQQTGKSGANTVSPIPLPVSTPPFSWHTYTQQRRMRRPTLVEASNERMASATHTHTHTKATGNSH